MPSQRSVFFSTSWACGMWAARVTPMTSVTRRTPTRVDRIAITRLGRKHQAATPRVGIATKWPLWRKSDIKAKAIPNQRLLALVIVPRRTARSSSTTVQSVVRPKALSFHTAMVPTPKTGGSTNQATAVQINQPGTPSWRAAESAWPRSTAVRTTWTRLTVPSE